MRRPLTHRHCRSGHPEGYIVFHGRFLLISQVQANAFPVTRV
jgi:hypothetical protein